MREPNDIVLLICAERTHLQAAFQSASESYSKAVIELSNSIGTASVIHYEELHGTADQARRLSIEARERLEGHIACHRCSERYDTASDGISAKPNHGSTGVVEQVRT